MQIHVQKYGGSSVSTVDRLRAVATKIVQTRKSGRAVVAVVSAMGDTTDHLVHLASNVSKDPPARELDLLLSSGERMSSALLCMAIQQQGVDAIALTGPQCGIRTSEHHNGARIEDVDTARLRHELGQGKVVVVAGFQGESPSGETTTLRRGGSDTTAIALAAVLGAERCQIFSDVDGVYSADPRVVPSARPLEEIDYQEMLELSRHGARVLHADAVELAHRREVTIQALSTFEDRPGTFIRTLAEPASETSAPLARGVAGRKDLVHLATSLKMAPELRQRLADQIDRRDILFPIADPTADEGADPAKLVAPVTTGHSGAHGDGGETWEVIVSTENMADPERFAEDLRRDLGDELIATPGLGSVSAVGLHPGRRPHAQQRLRQTLAEVPLDLRGHYETARSLSCLVEAEQVDDGVRAFHRALVESEADDILGSGPGESTTARAEGGAPSRNGSSPQASPEADRRRASFHIVSASPPPRGRKAEDGITIRPATEEDGAELWKLVEATGVLDVNSPYAYVLFASHFSDTTLVAELGGEPVGFVLAYVRPDRPDTVFVWQVAVSEKARGRGLAGRLLDALVEQEACSEVSHLEATITPSNQASQRLFQSFARRQEAPCRVEPYFGEDLFPSESADPEESHEEEELYRIGPFRQIDGGQSEGRQAGDGPSDAPAGSMNGTAELPSLAR